MAGEEVEWNTMGVVIRWFIAGRLVILGVSDFLAEKEKEIF